MADHNELGKKGEEIALQFLTDKGFTILETNWQFGKEEIDIIAINKTHLIVVEVKSRSTSKFGEPWDSVNKNKQRLLVRAAQKYCERFRITQEVRFDIISIVMNGTIAEVTHMEDAFYPVL